MRSSKVEKAERFLGVDVGAESLKFVEIERIDRRFEVVRALRIDHGKNPASILDRLYREWECENLSGAAATGSLCRHFILTRVPIPQAQSRAFRFFEPAGLFAGIRQIEQLGCAAAQAPEGVSLGQHCSVFTAEIIDQAVAAGLHQDTIIASLYDSIIQNYLNRVKGNRTVGQVIFCQGMPFSADALAAAVVRQTGIEVIVPPNPGTVGRWESRCSLARNSRGGRIHRWTSNDF